MKHSIGIVCGILFYLLDGFLPVCGQIWEAIEAKERLLKYNTQINTLTELACLWQDIDWEKSKRYAEQALQMATKNQTQAGEAESRWLLGQYYRQVQQYDNASMMFAKARQIFAKLNDSVGAGKTLSDIGLAHSNYGNMVGADSIFREAKMLLQKKYSNTVYYARFLYQLGVHTLRKGEHVLSIQYLLQAEPIWKEARDYLALARLHNAIGLAYKNLGYQRLALEYYLKTLRQYDALKLQHKGVIITLMNIANMYVHLKDSTNYSVAFTYYQRAKNIAKAGKEIEQYAFALQNIGTLYSVKHQYTKAQLYYDSAVNITEKAKLPLLLAQTYFHKADAYLGAKQMQEAKQMAENGLEICQKNQSLKDVMRGYMFLANCYKIEKNYETALFYYQTTAKYALSQRFHTEFQKAYYRMVCLYLERKNCEKAFEYATQLETYIKQYKLDEFQPDNWRLFAKVDSCRGDFKSALWRYTRYVAIKDSLDRVKRYRDTQEMQRLYDYETHEKENQLLKKQATWQVRDLYNQTIVLFLALGLLMFAFILLFVLLYFYKTQKRKNQKIETQNQELKEANAFQTKLISIVAHDLRRPYANLIGTLQLLRSGDLNEQEQKIIFAGLEKQTQDTNEFINNLLLWAKAQSEGFNMRNTLFSVKMLIESALVVPQQQAKEKNVMIIADISLDLYVYADIEMLKIVIFNLVTNAIKFTPENGQVKITSEAQGAFTQIRIEDNGVGISLENQQKILMRKSFYTSGTAGESGFGLGAIICHDFVELNRGNLTFSSEVGKGTTFTVTLPNQDQA